MILENKTFDEFGYYPRDLKPHSDKKILASCDGCEKVRETTKNRYRKLCKSCAYRIHASETARKISNTLKGNPSPMEGKHHTEETKKKMSETAKGRRHSNKTKDKISKSLRGGKHWNWQGGISFEPYCIKFDDEFKERVREFFERKCFVCNKSEEENKAKLDVHHVTYNKDTCCDDSIPLFVPLCMSCHGKTQKNRSYWEEIFTTSLMEKYNGKCFYTKDEWDEYKKELF